MKTSLKVLAAALLSCAAATSFAQNGGADAPGAFKQETIYGKWSKNLFADAVAVQGDYKTVYFAGMAAENPDTGKIDHVGDFKAQCKMSFDKIRKVLQAQGGDMENIVRLQTFVTDIRSFAGDYISCEKEAMGSAPMPPNTLLNVTQLAWPGMQVEIQATAVIPIKKQP
ncbi:MAG: RidA family protein [Paludibacterium sp.]|uniref:RidA family protein n=1 Tax=Paludibacterium sp. TaxID=1917523 RepID=UPI0025F4EFD7|nr:RidA family protein [Paludibacterium sp.]MBV8048902.1 RidA family protein [Paludibacterium sp.]MBV8649726.1 RidA family protein [Paludibacterium sp.]